MDKADGLQGIVVVYINQLNMSTARVIQKEHDMSLVGGKLKVTMFIYLMMSVTLLSKM